MNSIVTANTIFSNSSQQCSLMIVTGGPLADSGTSLTRHDDFAFKCHIFTVNLKMSSTLLVFEVSVEELSVFIYYW